MCHGSDMRISYDSRFQLGPRDSARKLLVVFDRAKKFIISYVGIAEIAPEQQSWCSVNEWLVSVISSWYSNHKHEETFRDYLTNAVQQAALNTTKLITEPFRLAVILTGYSGSPLKPIIASISNFHPTFYESVDSTGVLTAVDGDLPSSDGTFKYVYVSLTFESNSAGKFYLLIAGDVAEVSSSIILDLETTLRKAMLSDDPGIARVAVREAILAISKSTTNSSVSAESWWVVLRPHSSYIEHDFFSADSSNQFIRPDVIGFGQPVLGFTISQELPGYKNALARMQSLREETDARKISLLVSENAVAFLTWSPRLTFLAGKLTTSDREILSANMQFAPDVIALVVESGKLDVASMEAHINRQVAMIDRLAFQYFGEAPEEGKKTCILRIDILALILVGLDPNRYATSPNIPDRYFTADAVSIWPVTENMISLAKQFSPNADEKY